MMLFSFIAMMSAVAVIISYWLLTAINKQKRKRMKQLLEHFSHLGSRYNMAFTAQEILKNHILGFDGIQRKLLILSGINKGPCIEYLIDLEEVKSCSVKKHYGNIRVNGLKKRRLEEYLQKMVLHIVVAPDKPGIDIMFYKPGENSIAELPRLENRANKWKTMLVRLSSSGLKKTIGSNALNS
jgi:hypothetical protein